MAPECREIVKDVKEIEKMCYINRRWTRTVHITCRSATVLLQDKSSR